MLLSLCCLLEELQIEGVIMVDLTLLELYDVCIYAGMWSCGHEHLHLTTVGTSTLPVE